MLSSSGCRGAADGTRTFRSLRRQAWSASISIAADNAAKSENATCSQEDSRGKEDPLPGVARKHHGRAGSYQGGLRSADGRAERQCRARGGGGTNLHPRGLRAARRPGTQETIRREVARAVPFAVRGRDGGSASAAGECAPGTRRGALPGIQPQLDRQHCAAACGGRHRRLGLARPTSTRSMRYGCWSFSRPRKRAKRRSRPTSYARPWIGPRTVPIRAGRRPRNGARKQCGKATTGVSSTSGNE